MEHREISDLDVRLVEETNLRVMTCMTGLGHVKWKGSDLPKLWRPWNLLETGFNISKLKRGWTLGPCDLLIEFILPLGGSYCACCRCHLDGDLCCGDVAWYRNYRIFIGSHRTGAAPPKKLGKEPPCVLVFASLFVVSSKKSSFFWGRSILENSNSERF